MATKRKIKGFYNQGQDEEIPWTLDTSTWPSAPPNADAVTVTIYDDRNNDVSSTLVPGSVSVSGDDITFTVKDGTAGIRYRVEVLWTGEDSGVYEAFGELEFER